MHSYLNVQEKLPSYVRKHYPFRSNYLMHEDGTRQHYLDEGKGNALVMLHGNPTWSFYYRNLIKAFQSTHRVVVPDHVGSGLSDKPQSYPYRLETHIRNLEALLNHLNIENMTLVVHDWGGPIGLGYALRHPQKIKRLVILNTSVFHAQNIPFAIRICQQPLVGTVLIRILNAFARSATFVTTHQPLQSDVRRAYTYPYSSYRKRIGILRFVEDIPLEQDHPSYKLLSEIEQGLPEIQCPKLILWGAKDFCFTKRTFDKWQQIYPDAQAQLYPNAGHFVLEDASEDIILQIKQFIGHAS